MASITIYDVADAAKVSAKTVSRVLNDEPNVREEVRERVREAADGLGYRPNVSARRLRGSSSQLIIALADAALTLDHLRNARGAHFLDHFQLGAMMRCREAGFHLMVELVDPHHATARQQIQKLLGALRPDGVILTPPSCDDEQILDVLEAEGVAYVRLGPDRDLARGAQVDMDDCAAAAQMTRHLVELGHRDVGFIVGDVRYPAANRRLAGFIHTMRAAGLSVREDWVVQGDFTFDSGLGCGAALLGSRHRPTAVFASNDEMALGVMHTAARLGLATPGDVSVAGFDDYGGARFSIPPLTTIRQPVTQMSLTAAGILIDAANAKSGAPVQTAARLPFELVVRESTAPMRRSAAKKAQPASRLEAAPRPKRSA